MAFAALAISPQDADEVVARFRTITGLRGELKGSRINPTERGLLFEILAQREVMGWVAIADAARLQSAKANQESDLLLYSALLDRALGAFLPYSGGACADVVIDAGRYDPVILGHVRADVQQALGHWGQASMADSHRCAGIQIADVVANSWFNLTADTQRARRIGMIVQPWLDDGRIKPLPLAI